MEQDPILADALRAIAAGTPVNWAAIESRHGDASFQTALRDLRVISQIASFHQTLHETSDTPSASAGVPATTVDAAPMPTWGAFALLERVGAGAFGEVYRAWDGRLDREVGLKLLRRAEAPARNGSQFVHEGRLLARVRHPNIVTVYGADVIDGRVGIWMEFVRGRTLEAILRDGSRLSADQAVAVGLAVCRALGAVHRAGLVHRDVKAQNVMRDDEGRIVLMDFGTGEEFAGAGRGLAGTPAYVAPELLGGGPATPGSDIYAVGVLLFHLTTGSYPVLASSVDELRNAHARGDRRSLLDVRPDLPLPFVAVVERAMAASAADRFDTTAAMEAALSAAVAGEPEIATIDPPVAAAVRRGWLRRIAPAALAAAALLAAGAAGMAWKSPARPAVDFRARDWVLVTAFDNRTGDPSLDGTVEYALESELSNSQYVNVASRIRAEDTLHLMGKPADTRVDAEIGREICLRDGGIHALVSGRIEKLGTRYVLTASLIEPSGGRPVASVTEEASVASELSPALRRLSNKVRERFGEDRSAIRQSDEQLERVTTRSLKALRLYTESYRLGDREQWPAALDLAKRAVAEDPNFASARIWLAWALRNTRHAPSEYRAEAARAFQLADGTVDWERDWIVGSYHDLRGEPGEAAIAYEVLLRRHPDHNWAPTNLAIVYTGLGRHADAVPLTLRVAATRPNDVWTNWNAVSVLYAVKDYKRAQHYVDRVLALTNAGLTDNSPISTSVPRLFAAHESWRQGNARDTLTAVDAVVHRADMDDPARTSPALRDDILVRGTWFYLALGRIASAREAAARIVDADLRHYELAYIAWFAGDLPRLRKELDRVNVDATSNRLISLSLMAWLLGNAGVPEKAARVADLLERNAGPGGAVDIARGHIALVKGDIRAVTVLIDPGSDRPVYRGGSGELYRASATLSEALVRQHQPERAAEVLRTALSKRDNEVLAYNTGPFWMPLQVHLAELDRQLGHVDEAHRLEAELDALLAVADPDFPLKVKLKALQAGR